VNRHEWHPWRQVIEQKGQCTVNRSGLNIVVVIEDENEMWFQEDSVAPRWQV